MCGDVVQKVISADSLDVPGGPEDGPAKGRGLVGSGVEVVEYDLLYLLVHLLRVEGGGEEWRRGEEGREEGGGGREGRD